MTRKVNIIVFTVFTIPLLFANSYLNNVWAQNRSSLTGKVVLNSNIESFYVIIDANYKSAQKIQSGDTLSLRSALHKIVLAHPGYRDVELEVPVKIGEVSVLSFSFNSPVDTLSHLSSYMRLTQGMDWNISIRTDPGASIIIDDSTYGKGFVRTDIGPYKHIITIKHPKAWDKEQTVYLAPSGQEKIDLFVRPKRYNALLYSLVPGASQFYKKQPLKGGVLAVINIASAIYTYKTLHHYKKLNDEYESMKAIYKTIKNADDALIYGNLVEDKYQEVQNASRLNGPAIALTAGVYLLNILDALIFKPESGYRVEFDTGSQLPIRKQNTFSGTLKMTIYF